MAPENVQVPEDITITFGQDGDSYFTIKWEDDGADEINTTYRIYRSSKLNHDSAYKLIKSDIRRHAYDDTSVNLKKSGRAYYYKVSAVYKGVEGRQSKAAGVKITKPVVQAKYGMCRIDKIFLDHKKGEIPEGLHDFETRYIIGSIVKKHKDGRKIRIPTYSNWHKYTYNFLPLFMYEIDCKSGNVKTYKDELKIIRE